MNTLHGETSNTHTHPQHREYLKFIHASHTLHPAESIKVV